MIVLLLRFFTLISFFLLTFEAVASNCDDLKEEQDINSSQKQGFSDQDLSDFETKLTDSEFVKELQHTLKNSPQRVQKFFPLLFQNISDPQKYKHFQAVYDAADKKDPFFKKQIEACRNITFGKAITNPEITIDASFLYTLWQVKHNPWLKNILFQLLEEAFSTEHNQTEKSLSQKTEEKPKV